MPITHRNNDTRVCGAATVVTGQSSVKVEGELWAVEGDQNNHIAGDLVSTVGDSVTINGKKVIVVGDTAIPDNVGHPPPLTKPATGASTVNCY